METQILANYDLRSNQPFQCSLIAPTDPPALHSPVIPSPEMSQSPALDSPESTADSPIYRGRKHLSSGMDLSRTLPNSPGTKDGDKINGRDSSVSPNFDSKATAAESPRLRGGVFKSSSESTAAVKVQKVYRSYRTRRRLADTAVVAEELWWQAIDFARLNHSTISFFDFKKSETTASRWARISLNASKVGKGLSKDAKAQKMAFQHWIEAIDPRHRYGHCLHLYYEVWCKEDSGQPFFYWLDVGNGKEVDLKECPRSELRQQCIKYLGPKERENYEYIVVEGRILHKQTGHLLDTNKGSRRVKWIFVMSTSKQLYASEKKKGMFHHSSFLAGGATLAAGRLVADQGILKSVSPYSGHYRPREESLHSFLSFLKENGVNLDEIKICNANEDYDNYDNRKWIAGEIPSMPETTQSECGKQDENPQSSGPTEVANLAEVSQTETKSGYKRSLSGGLQSPRADVPKTAILQRINSKNAASSYQLGHQLSLKWSTGAGPRIGCVADYPKEVRVQALELVNLSPRGQLTPSGSSKWKNGLASPTAAHPAVDTCNGEVAAI